MSYAALPSLDIAHSVQLLLAGALAFALTYIFTFGVIACCRKVSWLDRPEARKIKTNVRPRLGGLGIFAAFVLVSLVLYLPTLTREQGQTQVLFGHIYPKEVVIYGLFLIASLLIVIIHAYDDIRGLKPLPKLLAQTLAALIMMGPGLHSFHGVLFFGVHNPFASGVAYDPALPWYQQPELTLFIREPLVSWLAIPAVIFTWFWFTGMMNAINFIDGLDGLAAGIVAIAGIFITIISWSLRQYSIALLGAIFTGAVAGFLPHNWNPARIIMGDSGAHFIGLALAMLAVMGGAKFALILMVLGIPILDIAWVAINRIRRGQNPMKFDILHLHYRQTHLHYRLLFGGLGARQICIILYSVTFLSGLLALTLPSRYKIPGFVLVALTMGVLLWWSRQLQDKRETQQGVITGEQSK
ncbi:undecaprenyl-phosphate alpha-N-acetylglucosaminyl 1-phosphate transferase [Ktedonobacter sp. SOSP1-52]|nr:MraY family glycosyltransferase [Ktedonobacter sp. SOSP1-52]GHO71275.1 undecaprenyl-phosphate alpha-N-acetylglucosaminyl 1-phosphate transferase [Ktedonobacter sp. SOSP1-52]